MGPPPPTGRVALVRAWWARGEHTRHDRACTAARRAVLLGLGAALLAPPALRAQPATRTPRVGVLLFGEGEQFRNRFRDALREHGWIDGENLQIEYRWAEGRTERLRSLASDLAALGVDVIVAQATPSIEAARAATATIPIVMASAGDALASGLVKSLARPGGNVTGLSLAIVELAGKTIALLRDILPQARRLACVLHGPDPLHRPFGASARAAAQRLGVALEVPVVQSVDELDGVFTALARARTDAILLQPIFVVDAAERARVVDLALRHRLPAASGLQRFAEAGGLISYSTEFPNGVRIVARYVDRLLRGAQAADLPIELPTTFDLVLNMKTARALGVTIPPAVLFQANRIIE